MSTTSQTSSSPLPPTAMQPSALHTPVNSALPSPSELSSLALSPILGAPEPAAAAPIPQPSLSSPKRPRSNPSLRALALTALVEDIALHNLSLSRLCATSPFAVPLPYPRLDGVPDGVLVCAAVHLARLDAVHPVAPDSAACALVACLASGGLAVARGAADALLLAPLEASAGLDAGEAAAYAHLVHVYLGEAQVGISVADFREFDEMLSEMVRGL